MYKKVVYISHPYSGKKENLQDITDIIQTLVKKHPTYLFVSPVHSFGFLYNTVDYQTGIEYCLWLLSKSDEMWVYGDYKNSRGCLIELNHCRNCSIPYIIKKRSDENDKYNYNS